ncbi:ACP phosphodiesterase [uncultured Desulfuromonas sp.]|uniref:acyl carrier protein phosphodiesterase n=1 Tax=uncultured Desulfuromonas sp. TaxID=181013 RepID=UPI002AAB8252|nr:ACP phosphodiesterase [uncultured Desulfuromonas sp.]
MNYLLHALLSDDDPLVRAGNLLGDFVKGRLTQGRFPDRLLHGLQQHRQLDRFAHDHPAFCRSQHRLDDRFGRYRGIMIDLFYDHFTARDWNDYHPDPLEHFSQSLYHTLQHHQNILPKTFLPLLPRMVEKDWLTSYRDKTVMQRALIHTAGRIRHDNPLAEGYGELEKHYSQLREDCRQFIGDARKIFLGEKTRQGALIEIDCTPPL